VGADPHEYIEQVHIDLRQEVETMLKARTLALPAWPAVAIKLQRLVSSDNFGLSDLAKLVEADQALAAVTLRTANSAFYRASAPVTTLPQAISRVGARELSNIAIASTLGAQAGAPGPLASLRKESWRKSLVGAAFAQVLARGRGLDPGEAFLAGLLDRKSVV
jgi:HD-like signal output (HDOD) protein